MNQKIGTHSLSNKLIFTKKLIETYSYELEIQKEFLKRILTIKRKR